MYLFPVAPSDTLFELAGPAGQLASLFLARIVGRDLDGHPAASMYR